MDSKAGNFTPVSKKDDQGSYSLVSLTLICGKTRKQVLLEAISKCIKTRKYLGIVSKDL